jgi:hypothetical protein
VKFHLAKSRIMIVNLDNENNLIYTNKTQIINCILIILIVTFINCIKKIEKKIQYFSDNKHHFFFSIAEGLHSSRNINCSATIHLQLELN